MRNRKKWMAAGIILSLIAGATGVWALASQRSVTNHLSTSVVDIELDTYKRVNGKEVLYSNADKEIQVMPGMQISQIPKITNEAVDCYVRAGIAIDGKWEVERPLSMQDISGFSKDWILRGDYYYYTKVLKPQDSVQLFDTITIPSEWTTKYDENGVADYYTRNNWDVRIRVDAIQAANFTPDFAGQSPWGAEGTDYGIQKCIHEDGYEINTYEPMTPPEFTVVYEGAGKELITSQDDFFAGIETLLPGDEKEGIFTMKNKGEDTQTFYFRTEILEEKEILEQIKLKIETSGKQIYEGPLNSRTLDSYISLCSLKNGETQDVAFTITVPKELDNEYTLNNCKVRWHFAVEEEQKRTEAVKTGDAIFEKVMLFMVIGTGALGFIFGILIRKTCRKRGGRW